MNEGTQPPPSRPARRPTYADHAALSAKVGKFLSGKFHATGLTREEAASRAGCTPGYLTGILAGRVVAPSPEIVRAMAERWGFDIVDYYLLIGLVTSRDIERYVAKEQVVKPSDPGEVQVIYTRLDAMPPNRRRRASKLFLDLLNTLEEPGD